jgi:nitrogen fixation protein NifU and related proteins
MYSDKVMDHFANPRNVGVIEEADGVGEEGNPVCGDMMTFYIKVEDGKLADVKYKTFGCGAAIAVSSILSTMAVGKSLPEALLISRADVATELDGLPKQKMHCSNLGSDALKKAIEDYLGKHPDIAEKLNLPQPSRDDVYADRFSGMAGHAPADPEAERPTIPGCGAADGMSCCPYCDAEIPSKSELCEPCGHELAHCPKCDTIVPKNAHDCPSCGYDMGH